jgi:hypothetical protein
VLRRLERACRDLGDDLVAVAEHLDQLGPHRLRQRRRARPGDLAKPPDRLGIDPVGLGPQTLRAGKVANLLGIDDGGRHPGRDQRPVQAAFAAARRLQDDQHVMAVGAQRIQQRRQLGVALRRVGKAPAGLARQAVDIKIIGRGIDPDAVKWARHGELVLVCGVRLSAGGCQLYEERRESSGRASCYDPV